LIDSDRRNHRRQADPKRPAVKGNLVAGNQNEGSILNHTIKLLAVGAPMALVERGIAQHFQVYRDADPEVRGIAVSGGHTRIDASFVAPFPKLEIVSSFGVGYDHIDAAALAKRGIVVTHTPDVLTGEVADLALGLLIATVRQLPQVDRYLRAGKWLERPYPLSATLRGRKVGILGLGRIGKAIAKRLEAFDLEVEYHGRKPQPDVKYAYHATLVDLAKSCDVLMVVASGGAETRHMVDKDVLEALGPDGILINVGRGSVVDEQALIAALKHQKILSAGLDVFEDEPRVPAELIAMEHVVLLPHVGSASVHTRNAMGQLVVDNLVSWFGGKGAITPVPECAALAASKKG
jgi:lactate dehydrogenase-like 2-hydroxyacid dehydrogenase